ncbi:nitroreductase [Bifidobacterium aemilianum]|uniref:Nitroreductase n=1 Tax=Bifidobacterium aemilianum TaxID=2493120 RepID=A0A366KB39_9BIFI|nr:nitroreductase family protein [Bifidobacterium aemilianum]RBP98388.1 nitroreductase [Bifidobacterium aemilianum]
MAEHNQLIDAVNIRSAIRSYDDVPMDENQARQLSMSIDAVNMLAELNMQLVCDQPTVFAQAAASGHFVNASNYLALVGPAGDDEAKERAGFYAERVILTATLWGLGSCWVGGSWDRQEAARHCRVTASQELYLGVILGPPAGHAGHMAKSYEELASFQQSHRTSRSFEDFTADMSTEDRQAAPEWFKKGVESAMKAPSALNLQPVRFSYRPADGTVAAQLDPDVEDSFALNDLGIAKLHFQIAAGTGTWAWGDGGLFIRK